MAVPPHGHSPEPLWHSQGCWSWSSSSCDPQINFQHKTSPLAPSNHGFFPMWGFKSKCSQLLLQPGVRGLWGCSLLGFHLLSRHGTSTCRGNEWPAQVTHFIIHIYLHPGENQGHPQCFSVHQYSWRSEIPPQSPKRLQSNLKTKPMLNSSPFTPIYKTGSFFMSSVTAGAVKWSQGKEKHLPQRTYKGI